MKKIAMLLALVLCVMTATTAMAETFKAIAGGQNTTVSVKVLDAADLPPSSSNPATDYPYGAGQVNQEINAESYYAPYSERKYCIFTPSEKSDYTYGVQIPYSFFGGNINTDVMAFSGAYVQDTDGYSLRSTGEMKWVSVPTLPSRSENHITMELSMAGPTPVVLAWVGSGQGGGNQGGQGGQIIPDPNQPINPVNPVNPNPANPAAGNAAASMPQTGDASNLMLMFALLAMSIAALGAMKLRREN